jgi:hypothetical protein
MDMKSKKKNICEGTHLVGPGGGEDAYTLLVLSEGI